VGKAKSCLRFESVTVSGLGNLGAITWLEMANSKATASASLTVAMITNPLLDMSS